MNFLVINTTLTKVVNWRDIAFVAIIQIVLKLGFINRFDFIKNSLSDFMFILLFISIILITISGYLINAYYNSHRQGIKKSKKTLLQFIIISFFGVLLGIYISYKMDKLQHSIIFILFWSVVILMSNSLEKKSFLKDIIISLLFSFSILMLWWFSEPKSLNTIELNIYLKLELIIILLTTLLFTGNLTRSILVSLKNLKKDRKNNAETLPTVFGEKKAKELLVWISVISLVSITAIILLYLGNTDLFFIFIPITIISQAHLYFLFKKAPDKPDYKRIIKHLDFILYAGLIMIPITAHILKNVIK